MLVNDPDLEPAKPPDAAQFDLDAGWGDRGTTLVDSEFLGRQTYFGSDKVGTMILSPGFVIRSIHQHHFSKVLPEILDARF